MVRQPPATSDPAFGPLGGPNPLIALQRTAGNRAVRRLVDRATTRPAALQRQDEGHAAADAPAGNASTPALEGILVEDDVAELRPEQMRRGDFVTQARAAAAQGVADGAGPLAARGAEEVQASAARYQGQSAAQLEATVRSEVESAAGATSATEMIAAIRESSSIEARARIASGLSDDAVESAKDILNNASQAFSKVTGMVFKARDGATPSAHPGKVAEARARLGAGEAAPGDLRGEVEAATGTDLSEVRLHRGGPSSAFAGELGARAFTVGHHIAIAGDEPGPGSLHGDALLAHELAHAAQQTGSQIQPAAKADTSEAEQGETAADDIAAEAVIGLRTGVRGRLAALGSEAARRIKIGLRLQSCGRAKIDPTKEELNKKVLEKMEAANEVGSPDKGVHYPFVYARKWPTEWSRLGSPKDGYADPRFWDRKEFMHWVRKPGVSASAAMDAFFGGPTIADCASVANASQIAALRAALGDTRFDKAFGGKGSKPREKNGVRVYLEISQSMNASVVAGLMRATDSATNAGGPGRRNVQAGELHYFANHPAYSIRHPTGFWKGENAVYAGEKNGVQTWTGFGEPNVTEQEMNATLVKEYNYKPSADDLAKRKRLYDEHGPDVDKWPDDVKKFHGQAPERIEIKDLLDAGGGFQGKEGQELDPAKVQALKDELDQE